LYTLGQLSQEFPEVSDILQARLQDADLRLPTKPPTKAPVKMSNMTRANTMSSKTNYVEAPPTQNSQGSFVQPRSFGMGL
jgi:hypothetical protein